MLSIDEIAKVYEESRDERLKMLRMRRVSPEDAEDILQETFYRALKYRDTFNPELQELKVWLDVIMNNAFKAYRHASMSGDYSFLDETAEDEEDIEDTAINKEMLEVIKQEITELPQQQRQIVYANSILGHSYKACCEIFDLPYATVQFAIQEFRKAMKEKYA